MMKFVIDTLLAHAGVQAMVGPKIYPQTAPQTTLIPYVTCTEVSSPVDRCREGIASETVRVQVNAIGNTYVQTDTLYRAIREALDGATGEEITCEYENARDLQREEGTAHGKAIDFQLIIS